MRTPPINAWPREECQVPENFNVTTGFNIETDISQMATETHYKCASKAPD